MIGNLNDLAKFLGRYERAIPAYVDGIKAAGLHSLTAEELVQNIDTRTLQSSETPYAGSPAGRGLDYGEGHSPLGAAERDAVLQAAGPFGVVGVANDAPYGIFIEAKHGHHQAAFERLPGVMQAAAPEAWRKAWRGSA